MRKDRGQIFVISVVLIPILLSFVFANFSRSLFSIESIQRQRRVDLLAMKAASEEARALNAIAALNGALKIMRERAVMYASALAALSACAASSLGVSPCTVPLTRLAAKAPKFFRQVNEMAQIVAAWQDEIAKWAEKDPQMAIQLHMLKSFPSDRMSIGPTRLRIHRGTASTNGLALQIPYLIPDSYVLNADFTEKQRVRVELISKDQTEVAHSLLKKTEGPVQTLSIATARIDGSDLDQMEFHAQLAE